MAYVWLSQDTVLVTVFTVIRSDYNQTDSTETEGIKTYSEIDLGLVEVF